MAGEIEALVQAGGQPGLLLVASLAGPVLAVPLYFRRTRPLLAMTLLVGGGILGTVLQELVAPAGWVSPNAFTPIFAILVASYSLGAFGTRRDLRLGLPQPLILIVAIDLIAPGSNTLVGAVAFFAIFLVARPRWPAA